MTYGQLKFRLTKAFPGVDADLIEGWAMDCYQEILGMLPWSRLDVESVLLTTAPYATGTVSVTQGSGAVVLAGGTWTEQMGGLAFRVAGDPEEYQLTFVDPGSGTLDRPYGGETSETAAYSIYQSVYPLPADCRFVDDSAFATWEAGPMRKLDREQAQQTLLAGNVFGPPRLWWLYMDDGSTPPQMQVRLSPVPDQAYGIPFTYCAEAPNPGSSGTTVLPWLQPAALIEGTTAKIKRHLKDYAGSQVHKTAYGDALHVMMAQEAYRRGPVRMEMGDYYSAYRLRRGRR